MSKKERKCNPEGQRVTLGTGEGERAEKPGRVGEGRRAENRRASRELALSRRPAGTVLGTETFLPRVAGAAVALTRQLSAPLAKSHVLCVSEFVMERSGTQSGWTL